MECGESAGVHYNYLARVEKDLVKPSWEVIIRLCQALDVSPNDIAEWEGHGLTYTKRASILSELCEAFEIQPSDLEYERMKLKEKEEELRLEEEDLRLKREQLEAERGAMDAADDGIPVSGTA